MPNQKLNNFLKDPRTNWTYIWIVVIVGFLAGAGILAYYYLWIKDLETRLAVIELKLPEKVTKNETANWKTYRNEEYGFEIKYPPAYRVAEETATIVAPAIKSNSYAQVTFDDLTGYAGITRERITNSYEKIRVGQLEAFRSPLGGNMDGGIEFEVFFFDLPIKDKIFRILFSTHLPGKEDEINIFNQMLSTFRVF